MENNVSDKILYYMVRKGLTTKQFAEKMEVSFSHVYAIMQKNRIPSKRMKIKFEIKSNGELLL